MRAIWRFEPGVQPELESQSSLLVPLPGSKLPQLASQGRVNGSPQASQMEAERHFQALRSPEDDISDRGALEYLVPEYFVFMQMNE
jgi:hypothetical protein